MIQRQAGKGLFPSRCLSPCFYPQFFFSHIHRDTHTHTQIHTQTFLASQSNTTSPWPQQSPTSQPSAPPNTLQFYKGAAHRSSPCCHGKRSQDCQQGHGQDTVNDVISPEQTLLPCCLYGFTTVITCSQKMGGVGPGFNGFDQKSRDMHTQAPRTFCGSSWESTEHLLQAFPLCLWCILHLSWEHVEGEEQKCLQG